VNSARQKSGIISGCTDRRAATGAEGASKDNEFSRRSIEERWLAGYRDTVHALRHPDVLEA